MKRRCSRTVSSRSVDRSRSKSARKSLALDADFPILARRSFEDDALQLGIRSARCVGPDRLSTQDRAGDHGVVGRRNAGAVDILDRTTPRGTHQIAPSPPSPGAVRGHVGNGLRRCCDVAPNAAFVDRVIQPSPPSFFWRRRSQGSSGSSRRDTNSLLEVLMNDGVFVRRRKSVCKCLADVDDGPRFERASLQALLQCLAVQQLHGDEEWVGADVVHSPRCWG